MAFSVNLAGFTFTQENFEGTAYARETTGLPKAFQQIVSHVAGAWKSESSSSILMGTGPKSLTVDPDKPFALGQPVRIARTSAPTTTYMDCQVTAYTPSTGAMTVEVAAITGSGTHSDWTVSLGGVSQITGLGSPLPELNGGTAATSFAGARTNMDLLQKSVNLSDLPSAATARTNLGLTSTATTLQGAGNGLDADLLDGQQDTYYLARANHTGTQAPATVSPQGTGSGLDADLLDGLHAAQISAGAFPAGTKMIFYQAAAPSGWTQLFTVNDKVLRVIDDGSGGTTGGSWTITGLSASPHQLTIAEMPAHTHALVNVRSNLTAPPSGTTPDLSTIPEPEQLSAATGSTGGDGTHTHGVSSNGAWRPAYANVLIATKN